MVTGASRGIGRCLVDVLADRGARISLVARNADALEKIVADRRRRARRGVPVRSR